MIWLILSITASVIIGNLLKHLSNKKAEIYHVFLGNYILASVFSLSINKFNLPQYSHTDFGLSLLAGFLLIICFILYRKNIHVNGLSVSVGFMRSALIIPIILSLLLFSEELTILVVMGIVLILFSFAALSNKKEVHNIMLLFMLFAFSGLIDFTFKVFSKIGTINEGSFLFYSFLAAALINIVFIRVKKLKFSLNSFLWGIVLGFPNQLTALFFIRSLDTIPSGVAYPMRGGSVVLLSVLTDIVLWKSKIKRKSLLIYAVLLCGVILINL